MKLRGNATLWLTWFAGTLAVAGYLGWRLFAPDADRTVFMPGPLSDGHHQLAESCDSCHASPFGGGEVLQERCMDCHGDIRKKPFDSHPRAKFTDPRNADRLAKINAVACVSCHVEHRPELTAKDGLTQPRDVCFHCHADVGSNRPSHAGMAFDTCASAGCHNYHDNRAIYTDFLVKHLDDPDIRNRARVPERVFGDVLDELADYPHDRYPVQALTLAQADVPATVAADPAVNRDWLETAHAAKGVNCSACHQPLDADGQPQSWREEPGPQVCTQCHATEAERFAGGKHGMRPAAGLAPMTPALARLPMQPDAAHSELTCLSCHGAHRFDTAFAAVEACLGCHADEHSLAYRGTAHERLWQDELAGTAPADSGVSCATCHLPRVDMDVSEYASRIVVDHNQSAALSPSTKMIRPACLHCHGLGFSIDALADAALVDRNFAGRPQPGPQTMRLAREDNERYLREREAAQ